MATTNRRRDEATRRTGTTLADVGREIRDARLAANLSQAFVAGAAGTSKTEVGRVERAEAPWLSIDELIRISMVVGLDVSVRAFPGSGPLRDAAHVKLLERFHRALAPSLGLRTEVPLPTGDRAWDAVVTGAGRPIGVEAESRLRDAQDLTRRVALKLRDGGLDRAILLLADTRWNRIAVRSAGGALAAAFPVPSPAALRALAEGVDPGGSAIVFL